MSEQKRGWYVLRAISGKENKVKEYLDAEIKNTDLGDYVSQVLIPTEKVYSVRNGKKITKEKNLYPGYVFVEALLVGEVSHRLRNTTNVIGFLGGTTNPDPSGKWGRVEYSLFCGRDRKSKLWSVQWFQRRDRRSK